MKLGWLVLIVFLFSPFAHAASHLFRAVQPGRAIAPAPRAITRVEYPYSSCEEQSSGFRKTHFGKHVIQTVTKQGDRRKFKLSFNTRMTGAMGIPHETTLESDKPARVLADGTKVWTATVTATQYLPPEKNARARKDENGIVQVTYLDEKGKGVRQVPLSDVPLNEKTPMTQKMEMNYLELPGGRGVFTASEGEGPGYHQKGFGERRAGGGSVLRQEQTVFDTEGNLSTIFNEVDDSKPAKRAYRTMVQCQAKGGGDNLGFVLGDQTFMSDSPAFSTKSLYAGELPADYTFFNQGTLDETKFESDVSPLHREDVQKALAAKLKNDRENLSPAREALAKLLEDGSGKTSAAYLARQRVLETLEYVTPPKNQ